MASSPIARSTCQSSKKSSSSETPPLVTSKAKGKQKEGAYHEIIDLEMDEDCDDVVLLGGKGDSNNKMDEVASNKKGKKIPADPPHSSNAFNPGSNNFFDLDDYVLDTEYWALQAVLDHDIGHPAEIKAPVPSLNKNSATSSVTSNTKLVNGDVKKIIYESFKKFDTVVDHSDHHYATQDKALQQPPLLWAKKIQEEWKILEKDLPDTIFVRAYESRMDLLRAVIIGAEGTPYHDGLFFFDVCFPTTYPNTPPLVYYHSGGLRINPNLYSSGYVCLSLLNTWSGGPKEMWVPGTSTMLQVLVSIQGLILNMKPYFNEPVYERSSGTMQGEKSSIAYNENTLISSLKTMVYTMNRPPKNFEDLVIGHFKYRVRDILMACKAYIEGAQVGCLVKEGVHNVGEGNNSGSTKFKQDVGSYITTLVAAFEKIGAKEAKEFLS